MERRTRGTDLRDLRLRAGLTQAELARRIGIPAPVLSAYETGRREPRVDVFFRAVEGAGFRVTYAEGARTCAGPGCGGEERHPASGLCIGCRPAAARRGTVDVPALSHAAVRSCPMIPADPLVVPRRAVAVHQSLREGGITSAVGGALALAFHVEEPRATRDIDLNVSLDRPKDWVDIGEMVAYRPPSLDLTEAVAWVAAIVGADDPRVTRLRSLDDRRAH